MDMLFESLGNYEEWGSERVSDRTRIFLLSVIDDPVIMNVKERESATIAAGMPARR
jgi:hypothetical protein